MKTIQATLADIRNGQVRTMCELCIITLCSPELSEELPLLGERVSRLEKALASGAALTRPAEGTESTSRPTPEPAAEKACPATDAPPFDLPETETAQPAPTEPETSPEKAPAGTAQEDGEWQKLIASLKGALPAGITAILSDPLQAGGELSDTGLHIYTRTDFALNMINRPDVISRIAGALKASRGEETRVTVKQEVERDAREGGSTPQGSLDELAKFSIVKFK